MSNLSENRICQNCKSNFTIDADDFSFYNKMQVPPPTFCPECRMIRRFNFRNECDLFRRPDAHTGKEIFSTFPPESNVKVYENNYWFSDEWNQLDSGVPYDFTRPFFDQFQELLSRAPIMSRSIYNLVNSDYCNEASEMKNSYLCFNCDYIENSGYIRKMNHVKDSFDCHEGTEDELCYENVMVDKSYRTFFSVDCESCVDVWFSKGLRGCTNCFGCVNLTKKSNYFFNEPCTKEEYDAKVAAYTLGSHKEIVKLKNQAHDFWLRFPVKYNHTLRTIDSTGERVFDSKNVKDSYSVRQSENLRFCQDIQHSAANSYDYSVWGDGAENMYECMTCGLGSYNLRFCFNTWGEARDLEYCGYCQGSKNCFGCVGLYKKEYCIFNVQYTVEEYKELREKIIAHMNEIPYVDSKGRVYSYGEFFPFDISPLAYNQSLAQNFFPLDEGTIRDRGYLWNEYNRREFQITLNTVDIPDTISEVSDTIINEALQCGSCNRAFRIISSELQFYRKIGLPVPRFCHTCRALERFKFVNPPKLWSGICKCEQQNHVHGSEKCSVEFKTSYSPDRPEITYCEKCFQEEVA